MLGAKQCGDDKIEQLNFEIRLLMKNKNYSKAITTGLTLYNRYFERTTDYNKYIITYNLAWCYKKNEMYQEAIEMITVSLNYVTKEDQSYYRNIWLLNECEIALGIDSEEIILERYNECSKYYKHIEAVLMRAYIMYNIAKYKKHIKAMYRIFKIIDKEGNVGIPVFISYDKRQDILDILKDFKTMDYKTYKLARNYLNYEI